MAPPLQSSPHRVVVVGGGFGGLQAALKLARAPVEVTLVDRRNFHLFQPLAYQVATGAPLAGGDLLSRCARSSAARATSAWCSPRSSGFDLAARGVALRDRRASTAPDALDYDTLIVAGGVAVLLLRPRRVAASTRAELKSLEGALDDPAPDPRGVRGGRARARPRAPASAADVRRRRRGPDRRRDGGPDRRDRARHPARRLPRDRPRRARASCSSRRPTASSPRSRRRCRRKAQRSLERLGVTALLDRAVIGLDARRRHGARRRRADRAHPDADRDLGRGRDASPLRGCSPSRPARRSTAPGALAVEPDLTLPGHPEVLAIGDMVAFARPTAARVAARRRAGGDAAGPPRGARRRATASRGRDRAPVPLPRQGQPRDDRPRPRGGRRQGRAPQRLPRLGHLARRAPLLPDRLPEPRCSSSSAGRSASSTHGRGARLIAHD